MLIKLSCVWRTPECVISLRVYMFKAAEELPGRPLTLFIVVLY